MLGLLGITGLFLIAFWLGLRPARMPSEALAEPSQLDRNRVFTWGLLAVHALAVGAGFVSAGVTWLISEAFPDLGMVIAIGSAVVTVLWSLLVMVAVAWIDLTTSLKKSAAVAAFLGHIILMVLLYVPIYANLDYTCANATPPRSDWATHLYFSMVTFTTLGYGDCQPVDVTRFFAASQALLSYVLVGLFVGLIVRDGPIDGRSSNPMVSKPRPKQSAE